MGGLLRSTESQGLIFLVSQVRLFVYCHVESFDIQMTRKKHDCNKMDLAGNHCNIRRASMTEKKPKKIVLDANENEFVRASEVC